MRAEDVSPDMAANILENYFHMFLGCYLAKHTTLTSEQIKRYTDADISHDLMDELWARHFKKGNQTFTRWMNTFCQDMVDYKMALDAITVQDMVEVTMI